MLYLISHASAVQPLSHPSIHPSIYPSIRLFSNQHSISGCRELKSQANNMTQCPTMNSNRQSNQFFFFFPFPFPSPTATTTKTVALFVTAAERLNAIQRNIRIHIEKTLNIFFSCNNCANNNSNNAPQKPQKKIKQTNKTNK